MADASTLREMEAEITAALAKMGRGGRVVVRDGAAELHAAGGSEVVAIDLGEWIEQWGLLPPEMRARRAEALAQRLRNAGRASQRPAGAERKAFPIGKIAAAAAVVVLAAVVIGWLRMSGFFGSEGRDNPLGPLAGAPASGSASAAPAPSARIERTCEAARSRMRAGAAMGVDIDGWVVELWLARDPSDGVAFGELGPIKAALEGDAAKQVTPPKPFGLKLVDPARPSIGADQAVLRYGGGFVTRFFSVDGREALVGQARGLAAASNARYAALYARCAHLPFHDVGSWYGGRDKNGAAVAMLYAAGTFAEPAALDVAAISKRGMPLDALEQALGAAQLDVAEQVRLAGGRVSDDLLQYTFALGGPTLATKTSRTLAGKLNL